MKKSLLFIILALAIPILISQKPTRNGDKTYVDGQIMVKLRSDVSRTQQDQMLQELLTRNSHLDLRLEQKLSARLNIVLLNFAPGRLSDGEVLEDIKADPNVELAQFNHFIEQRELVPSDQYFGLQWNMHNTEQTGGTSDADIDGPEAWGITTSGFTATGDEIVVGIVDDGFDLEHEDLLFWKNTLEIPGNSVDDDNNGYIDDYDGWNAWSNSGNIIERDHGTHVTGIACAQGNNDRGVAGVNLDMKAIPIVGSATVESIVVAAYGYMYEMRSAYNESGGERGAFIVSNNCSFGVNFGQPEDYPIWGAMYDSLGTIGILSAGATANADWDIDEVGDIPSAFTSEWLITVTNTDEDDDKNNNAAYGDTTIDLGAPGTEIYSTRQNNQYGYKTGCSMSAPHVAGAIAYLFSVADEGFMQAYHNDPGGKALEIKQCLLAGVDTVPDLVGKTVTGGRLNIFKAAQLMPVSQLSVTIMTDRDNICEDDSTQLTAQVIGATGNPVYSWSSDPAGFTSSEAVVTVEPAVSTSYFVHVSDDNGGLVNDTILIVVHPFPEKPVIISGPAKVDNFTSTTSTYTCEEAQNTDSYTWSVVPEDAGISSSTGTEANFLWANDFTGIVTITVTGVNDCGTSEVSEQFTTEIYSSQGTADIPGIQLFSIWPNPTPAGLSVKVSGLSAGLDHSIVIYNAAGKQMQIVNIPYGIEEMDLDISSLTKGLYFVTLKDAKQMIFTRKLVIN